MDTTSSEKTVPPSAKTVKNLLILSALILLVISGYLYFTSGGRLDREIQTSLQIDGDLATELASMPAEVRELIEAERNTELLKRHAAFATFFCAGVLQLLLALLLKRRALLVAITALFSHLAASGLYLFLAKAPAGDESLKSFGGSEMTFEKQAIWAMMIIGAVLLLLAVIMGARRRPAIESSVHA